MPDPERTPNPDPSVIRIVPGCTSPPTCLVNWIGREFVFDCGRVRELASAMQTAAARAEAEAAAVAFMRGQNAPDGLVGRFLAGVRAEYAEPVLGIKGTITLIPSVSMFDGRPFAHANVKPYEPLRMSPEQLRSTAADWYGAAESAERDAVLAYTLREATDLTANQIEHVFEVTRTIRTDHLPDDGTVT